MSYFDAEKPLPIVLRCSERLFPKARYTFDTLFMARGVSVVYCTEPPSDGCWLLYSSDKELSVASKRCLTISHCPEAWKFFDSHTDVRAVDTVEGLETVFPQTVASFVPSLDIPFDITANAFYFLSSWSERLISNQVQSRSLHKDSIFSRLGVPQDIVDRYLARLMERLGALCGRIGLEQWKPLSWPEDATYAVVLSHDVDFIPNGTVDILMQGVKTVLRHLVRQRDPVDAVRSAVGLLKALIHRRDPYGCVPEIIKHERELGLSTSFQIAVAHRHPRDVNYKLEDDWILDYLRTIPDNGFDLCLHGSYQSTDDPAWYLEEVALLTQHLGKPLGSRQHFLSFDYDSLFAAQTEAGIQYDMSMGFPDHPGPRAGFSYPYFPYCLKADRPYNVLQISLFLMDVTLRSYLKLKGEKAWETIKVALHDLRNKRGCASAVWHPIVFGGARDPGYDRLFWDMVNYVRETNGLTTDGRTINNFWRSRAKSYTSFQLRADRSF